MRFIMRLFVVASVICLGPAVTSSLASPILLGTVVDVVGTGTITRDGVVTPIAVGMDVLSGDRVRLVDPTSASNTIRIDLGIVPIELQLCPRDAIQELDEGWRDSEFEINAVKPEADITYTGIKLNKGLIRSKVEALTPGQSFQLYDHYCSGGVRGTEFVMAAYDTGRCDMSVLNGSVLFDNILWETLPDFLFTNPAAKSLLTLDLDALLASRMDIGAGNQTIVPAGYYSQVFPGGLGGPTSLAPTTPALGVAPGSAPCCQVPEPTSLMLLGPGIAVACARLWRNRRAPATTVQRRRTSDPEAGPGA